MNKKLILSVVALIAVAQIYAEERSYRFASDRPVKVTINQAASMGGRAKPSLNFPVKPGIPTNTATKYFIESITITDQDGKSYTWHSQGTGKGQQNVGDIRYWGADEKLNRGGMYTIVAADDERKFNNENDDRPDVEILL